MVPKQTAAGGTYRLSGDYRQMNKLTIEDKYMQFLMLKPCFIDIVFSNIDLVKAYITKVRFPL